MANVNDVIGCSEGERVDDCNHEVSQSQTSRAWPYFLKIDNRKVMCRVCLKNNPLHKKTLTRNSDGSTTNMWRHLRTQHEEIHAKEKGLEEKGRQRTIPDVLSSNTNPEFTGISFSRLKDFIAEYVCKLDRPWRAVEDLAFRRLLRYCAQKHIKIPSRKTIRRHSLDLYKSEKDKLFVLLYDVRRVSLTVDTWTSENGIALLGVTVHWIDDEWQLRERVLALRELEGEHSGENMAEVLMETLMEYCVDDKICAVTTDNATNNRTMVDAIIRNVNSVRTPFDRSRHMPCLAHVVNLAVQDGLKHLYMSSSAAVADIDGTPVNTDVIESSVDKGQSVGDIVNRVRQLLKAIRSSTQRMQVYKDYSKDLHSLSHSIPPLDCPTRWNSTYQMLVSAYEHRKTLEKMAIFGLAGISRANYLITEVEWDLVCDFILLLEPFQEMTDFLCQSKRVTASKALLVVRVLIASMKGHEASIEEGRLFPQCEILDDDRRSTIKRVCRAMISKMEKYEERLRGSNAFAVASVLDPRSKMEHIPLAEQAALKAHIVELYRQIPDENVSPPIPSSTVAPSSSATKNPRGTSRAFSSLLARWETRQPTLSRDEVEAYLQCAPVNSDALTWWRVEGSLIFPKLAILAKDFLAVCATSAPAERFFSAGRSVTTFSRSRLNAESVSTLMSLKRWLRKSDEESKTKVNSDDDVMILEDEDEDYEDDDDDDGGCARW